jgi:hypothetical protein
MPDPAFWKRPYFWLGVLGASAFLAYRAYSIRRDATATPGTPPPRPSAQSSAALEPVHHVPLDPATRRKMRLNPRSAGTSALAFAKARLGQVTREGVSVRSVATFKVDIRLELEKPLSVVALADGSLLCPDTKRTLRLFSHDQKPRAYPLMPLIPGSQLFGDRVDSKRVWALGPRGKTLFRFELADDKAPLLAPKDWVDLDGFDQRTVGSLRDGSFLFTTSAGFSRFFGKGALSEVKANSEEVFRVLPGSRADAAWLLRRDRRVSLHGTVEGKLARLQTVNLETDPFDAEAAGTFLAVLELDQPSDAPATFVLEVFDTSGKRRFRTTLPAEESFDEDWAERLTQNRNLAVSADPPRVAVGGPTELTVFDAGTGARVFSEP